MATSIMAEGEGEASRRGRPSASRSCHSGMGVTLPAGCDEIEAGGRFRQKG